MNLSSVMDEVATRLATISGLRVYAWPADSVSPPAAVVSFPERIDPHVTYQRGGTRYEALPVVVVVGRTPARATRDLLAAYVNDTGASSVIAVLETGTWASCHEVTVTAVETDVVTIAGTDYLAAIFDLDIMGSGS